MTHLSGFGQRVQPHQIHLQRLLLLHGQRQRQVAEGVKGHRDLGAHGAHQSGLEEAVEDIHYDGVVPLDVVLPGLLRHHLQEIQRSVSLEPPNLSLTHTHTHTHTLAHTHTRTHAHTRAHLHTQSKPHRRNMSFSAANY